MHRGDFGEIKILPALPPRRGMLAENHMFDEIISKIKVGEMNVSTDTRTIKPGDIFFAIKGDQFDGHDFVKTALEKGAAVCVVSREHSIAHADIAGDSKYIIVDDTLVAIQQLATLYRKQFSIPVIGISGCNGKTTTKNFIASVLREHFGEAQTLSTLGNHNNFIGVPLTVLSLRPQHKAAVIELGSNHPGEIAMLCDIAQPTHGITTNIGAAHVEFFGTLDAIADEEGAVAAYIPAGGAYVLPKDDQYSERIAEKTKSGVAVHFVDAKHVECLNVEFANEGGIKSRLASIGVTAPHVAQDALFVLTVAHVLGIDAETALRGIAHAKNDEGRFSIIEAQIEDGKKITIIDDTYNGNPDSVIAAIKAMAELFPDRTKKVALGELKELGEYLHIGYGRIVNACSEYGIAELVLINIEDTFSAADVAITHVKDNAGSSEHLKNTAKAGDVILCKGSHGARTWEVIENLRIVA